jgi:hypothetical protein
MKNKKWTFGILYALIIVAWTAVTVQGVNALSGRDLYHNTKPAVALNIQSIATDTTTAGTTVDLHGYGGVQFVAMTGTITDGDYLFKVYESDTADMSGETVNTTTLNGTPANWTANSDDNKIVTWDYRGVKRYVRLKVVSTSTTTGGYLGAAAIKFAPTHAPSQ